MDRNELAEWLEWLVQDEFHNLSAPKMERLRQAAAALRESEEWRRDAERFAWLRDNPEHGSVPYFEDGKWHAPYLVSSADGSGCGVGLLTYETLGDAIDAARKEG
jgi:hypothetical protein